MFIHVIRGAAAGLAATALIGTTFAIFARAWVAVLFGACALGIFIGIARLVWSTSNQPLVDPGKSQLGPFHTLSGKLLIGLLAAGAVVGGALTVAVDALPLAPLAGYGPAALGYGLYGFIAVGLWDATRRHRVEFARLKGAFPDRNKIWKSLAVVIPLLLFSYGTVWVVYYPLSIFSTRVSGPLATPRQLVRTIGRRSHRDRPQRGQCFRSDCCRPNRRRSLLSRFLAPPLGANLGSPILCGRHHRDIRVIACRSARCVAVRLRDGRHLSQDEVVGPGHRVPHPEQPDRVCHRRRACLD